MSTSALKSPRGVDSLERTMIDGSVDGDSDERPASLRMLAEGTDAYGVMIADSAVGRR